MPERAPNIAGVTPRGLAVIADTVVICFIAVYVEDFYRQTTLIPRTLYTIGLIILPFLYFTFFETYNNGQTLGKWLFRIRVVKFNGKPVTVTQS